MILRNLYSVTVASVDTNGADLAGFSPTDTGTRVTGGTFFNQDVSGDALLVSLDGGSTWPVRIAAGSYWQLPQGGPWEIGGVAGNGLKWKAAANTCDNPSFVYSACIEAEDV